MAFDGTGKTFTFAGAANIHGVADGEGVSLDDVAYIDGRAVIQPDSRSTLLRGDVSLCKVAFHGLVCIFSPLVAENRSARLHNRRFRLSSSERQRKGLPQ